MNIPVFRHFVFSVLVLGVVLAAPIHAQDCSGGGGTIGGSGSGGGTSGGGSDDGGLSSFFGGGDSGSGGSVDFSTFQTAFSSLDQNFDSDMTALQIFAVADTSSWNSGNLVNVSVIANPTVYAESPTPVSSVGLFYSGYTYEHSIEYINVNDFNAGGAWTTNIDSPVYGGPYQRTISITYPTPGTYYVRAGGLVTDWATTWDYSNTLTVTAQDPNTNYTVTIQTHPDPGMEKWILPSNVVSKTFQVFHSN
jgi:hypothetical protein